MSKIMNTDNLEEFLNPFELTQNPYIDGDSNVENNEETAQKELAVKNLLNGNAKGTEEKYHLDPVPFLNRLGQCYAKIANEAYKAARTDAIKMNRSNMDYTNDTVGNITGDEVEQIGLNLLMPQYKRRVEVEDLNENFWVISCTLDAVLSAIWKENGIVDLLGALISVINMILDFLGILNVQKISLLYNGEEDTTVDMYSRFSLAELSIKLSTNRGERIIDDIFRQHNKTIDLRYGSGKPWPTKPKDTYPEGWDFSEYIQALNKKINDAGQEFIYDSNIISNTSEENGSYITKILSDRISETNNDDNKFIAESETLRKAREYSLIQNGQILPYEKITEINSFWGKNEVKEYKEDVTYTKEVNIFYYGEENKTEGSENEGNDNTYYINPNLSRDISLVPYYGTTDPVFLSLFNLYEDEGETDETRKINARDSAALDRAFYGLVKAPVQGELTPEQLKLLADLKLTEEKYRFKKQDKIYTIPVTVRFCAYLSQQLADPTTPETILNSYSSIFDFNQNGKFDVRDVATLSNNLSQGIKETILLTDDELNRISEEDEDLYEIIYSSMSEEIKGETTITVPNARLLSKLAQETEKKLNYSLEKPIYIFLYDKNAYSYSYDAGTTTLTAKTISSSEDSNEAEITVNTTTNYDNVTNTLTYPDFTIERSDNYTQKHYCIFIPRSDLVNGEIIQLHLNPKNIVSEQTDSSETIQRFGLYDSKKRGFTLLTKEEEIKYPFLSLYNSFSSNETQYNFRTALFFKDTVPNTITFENETLIGKNLQNSQGIFDKNSIFQNGIKASYYIPFKDDTYEKSATLKIKASMFASHWPIIDNTYYYNSLFLGNETIQKLQYLPNDEAKNLKIKRQQLYTAAIRNNLVFYGTPALRMNNQFYHSSLQALQSQTIRGNNETMQRGRGGNEELADCFDWEDKGITAEHIIAQITNNNIEPSKTKCHLEYWFGRRECENYVKKKKIKYIVVEREEGSRHNSNCPNKLEITYSNGYIEKEIIMPIESTETTNNTSVTKKVHSYPIKWYSITKEANRQEIGIIKINEDIAFDNVRFRFLRENEGQNETVIVKMFYVFGEDNITIEV